eukprot:2430138-Prorocentrum_lima.AAC.1
MTLEEHIRRANPTARPVTQVTKAGGGSNGSRPTWKQSDRNSSLSAGLSPLRRHSRNTRQTGCLLYTSPSPRDSTSS